MSVSLDVEKLKRQHAQYIQKLNDVIEQTMKEAGEQVKQEVADTSAFQGTVLRKTVKVSRLTKYSFQTSMDSKVAVYMNDGTRPHEIRARRVKFLRFQHFGITVFRKRVYHPGTQATHFFDEANQSAFIDMIAKLNERIAALKF